MPAFKYSQNFIRVVNQVWQQIGSDCIQCAAECDESMDNAGAVEGCIDADRLVSMGGEHGKEAQEEFRARIAAVGYDRALEDACNSLPYRLV